MAKNKKKKSLTLLLRNYFITGVVVLIPIGFTLYLTKFIIGISSKIIPQNLNPNSYLPFAIPGLEIIISVFFITIVGGLSLSFLGKRILKLIDDLFKRIPVLRTIYSAIVQMTETFSNKDDNDKKSVVLVEYPRKGVWAVGFATKENKGEMAEKTNKKLINVFVPTTPNPTSGFLLMFPIDDVIYLADIYPQLRQKLATGGRDKWVEAEMRSFADLSGYITDPDTAWKRLKPKSKKADFLTRLKYLAAWRETEAKKRNMPRGRILRDDTLMDLAGSNPKNDNQLNKIRGFPKNQNNPFRSDIISVLGKAATDDSMMEVTASVRKDIKPPAATVELLRVLLKHVAEQQDVASRLIASAQQLDDLATGNHLDHPCLSGWRHDIFGKQAMQLIDGKLALSLSGNEIRLTETG